MTDSDEAPPADGADPGADFAELMTKARAAAGAAPPEAPHGYVLDPATGTLRPKKSPGRPRKPGSKREAARAAAEAAAAAAISPDLAAADGPDDPGLAAGMPEEEAARRPGPEDDVTPGTTARPRRPVLGATRRGRGRPPAAAVGMPRPGVIAAGVNRMYRRAGKIIRAWDGDIGAAFIAVSRSDPAEQEDTSVGAAWEELARTNPRVRAMLVHMIGGSAVFALLEAHLPIFAAIVIKEAVHKRIPFGRVLASMAEPDEDSPPGGGGLPFGMSVADVQAAAATFAQSFPGGFPQQQAAGTP